MTDLRRLGERGAGRWEARATVCAGIWCLVQMDRNPAVWAISVLGLSPAPLERFTGIKGPFSGMTEGVYQLANGNVAAALASNVLTPLLPAMALCWAIAGYVPRIQHRRDESYALGFVIVGSILVNLLN